LPLLGLTARFLRRNHEHFWIVFYSHSARLIGVVQIVPSREHRQMPELPNDPGLATADGASSPEPSWQNRVRTIFRRRSVKSALVVAAIAISGSSGYLAYHSKTQRALEAQSQNDRPRIAIINAAIEGH
jgi:hypothetical protein